VERNNTQAKYDELMRRVMEARVAQGLEKEQMGERFTLIDPARLPEKPVKPNVPAILLIGLFLGIGSGVGLVAVREFSDNSVRTAAQLAFAIPYPVIGTIPYITTEKEKADARRHKKAVLIGGAVAIFVAIIVFHFFVMDLDIFWAKVSRRM
jgi:capsular polysaccharide biosynthesis protein